MKRRLKQFLAGLLLASVCLGVCAPAIWVQAKNTVSRAWAVNKKTADLSSQPDDMYSAGQTYQSDGEVLCGTDPGCIFIGDSRTVGMSAFVKKNDYIWSAKNGVGLAWMQKTGVPQVEGMIGPSSNVIVMMGFNDIFYAQKALQYASYLNEKAALWEKRGARVYFVSVNPITYEEVLDGQITNERIAAWNQDVRVHLSKKVTYIDTFSMVYETLSASDGIHYEDSDYQVIYDLIMDQLNEVEDEAKRETENLEDFVPKIMSAVKNAAEGTIKLSFSKPDGIKNVFYEVEVFDPLLSTWAAAARVKTTTVQLAARDDDMKMRARAYKSYRAGISYSKWSDELIIGEDGSIKTEKEHWWIRLHKWVSGLFV
ncbi:MAG: hypothetical protein IJT32_03580 [Lachnospiraceae bacterium]|nr:hypothetical protein [Lachnospiraceae bacterium]